MLTNLKKVYFVYFWQKKQKNSVTKVFIFGKWTFVNVQN